MSTRNTEKYQWRSWAADPEGITGQGLLDFINNDLFPALKDLPVSGANRVRVVRDVFEDANNYMKSGQLMRQVINKINAIDFNNLSERQHFGDVYEQLLNDLQSAGNAGEFYTPRAVTAFMAERIDPRPGETLFDPACGTGGLITCAIRYMREKYVKTAEDEAALQSGLRGVEKKQLPHMLCTTNMLLHGIENPSFIRHDNTLARPYASIGTNLLFFEKGEPTQEVWFYEHEVPQGQKAYSMTRPIRLEHLQGCVDWWGGHERKGRQETEQAWRVSLDDIKARNYNLDFKNPHTEDEDHGEPEEILEKLNAAENQVGTLRDQLKSILEEALTR